MVPIPDDPSALLRSLEAAWVARDVDRIMDHFSDEPTYHNVPLEPARGRDGVRRHIEEMLTVVEDIDFEVVHEVVDGNVVLNERVDTIVIGGVARRLPVAGVFEFDAGRISRWSDYFDLAVFTGEEK